MDEDCAHLLAIRDEAIPPLPEMLGPGARDFLSVAMPAATGITAFRTSHVVWRPGRSVAVRYDLRVSTPAGEEPLSVVAFAGKSIPGSALLLGDGESRIGLSALPDDPVLPGLAVALDPARARALLDAVHAPAGAVSSVLRAYRPGRRAVVELRSGATRAFVKVVRPQAIRALQDKHRHLASALPVPASHGWSGELGLVMLEALPGRTIRETLAEHGSPLPDPATLAALLDRIPALPGAVEAPTPLSTLPVHANLVRRIIPSLAPALDAIVETAGRVQSPATPLVPVHADFHEAQVLVLEGRITGLLDVDTAAAGHRIDDWSTFVGHLVTWADGSPDPGRVRDYARRVLAFADQETGDPAGLRTRIAAVITGLATGPFRVQMSGWVAETRRRVELARLWLEGAETARVKRKKTLMTVSTSSHTQS